MPFADVPPPLKVEVRECGRPSINLFASPALAFACAGLIENAAQRDRILRDAFVTAITQQPDVARRYLSQAIERPWVTDAGFFPVLKLAVSIAPTAPQDARTLLLKAAQRYAGQALREPRSYSELPFGREVFEQAARAAPDEAVGLASGASVTAEMVLSNLRNSRAPDIQWLGKLADDTSLDVPVRQRAAVFFRQIASGELSIGKAKEAADGPGYFPAVAKLRIGASGEDAALYNRVLENYAAVLFRGAGDSGTGGLSQVLRQLQARDLYLLLTYGRTEEDDALFATVFDRLLLPKLRATPPAKLLDDLHDLNLRRFLTTAIAHHRLDAFLATAGSKAQQAELLARSVKGIGAAEHPVDETLAAAEILASVREPARLLQMRDAILSEYARGGPSRPLYGLLAAELSRNMGDSNGELPEIASRYQGYFKEPRTLDAAGLFNAGNLCIQQQFFYDDDDGADSFESFKQHYAKDPAWQWEDRGWYVHVIGSGASGRRIEIYTNAPRPILSTDSDNPRHALMKMMNAEGLAPSVVVHRGHTWYVDESLRYLTPSARLVFLGSCHGMESAYAVMAIANRAQMIATRGIGTQSINDPLLKAINDQLLKNTNTLEWEPFWRTQEAKLGGPTFRDYIPPPRNASAIMLAAYYDYLADGKP